MAKMRMATEERKDVFLYGTTIENFFINEMLPKAPGNYVKVFIFGCMYSQYQMEIDTTQMAHTLGLSEQELIDAWKYWEAEGLVKIQGSGQFDQVHIEFIRQIDMLYGKTDENPQPAASGNGGAGIDSDPASKLINVQLRDILGNYQEQTGRTVSRREAEVFRDALELYNIASEVLDFAVEYSASLGLEKCNANYIVTVARNWKDEGCDTLEQVRALMDEHELKNGIYKQIFKEMGWNRAPSPGDKDIIDKWLNVDGYTLKDILDACRSTAGLRNPSFSFVDSKLKKMAAQKGGITVTTLAQTAASSYQMPWEPAAKADSDKPEAKVSNKVLNDYYEHIRDKGKQEQQERIEDAKKNVPGMDALLAKEAELNSKFIMLSGPDRAKRKEGLTNARRELEEEKKILLAENGRPEDYLERKYECNICKDTGYTDEGMFCKCRKERAEEAYVWYRKQNN